MASGKGADSTKSTTFGLVWGSLHFGGRRGRPATGNPRKIKEVRNGLDFVKSTILLPLWGSLHFDRKPRKSRVPSDIVGCDI